MGGFSSFPMLSSAKLHVNSVSHQPQVLDTGKMHVAFYFIWRVLVGGVSRHTIFSSRPLVSIAQSIPCALRMASVGFAAAAVEQCDAPLNVTHTSY
jgi:hypothetical protein